MQQPTDEGRYESYDVLIAGGMSEKKATVLTLKYLCGFFSEHIQKDNLNKVLETVEKSFRNPKIT